LTQEPSVFDGTIYDNLIYALDYVPTERQVADAIYQSQCDFIDGLP
jgi:ABC-type multidrug transport system fused ATPase/permease subunit